MAPDGIAFPWHIGCGLAGGSWEKYSGILHGFACNVPVPVFVVQLPSEATPAPSPRTAAPMSRPTSQPTVAAVAAAPPAGTVEVMLPLPYAIPPARYVSTDEPWASGVPRSDLDVFGRTWRV